MVKVIKKYSLSLMQICPMPLAEARHIDDRASLNGEHGVINIKVYDFYYICLWLFRIWNCAIYRSSFESCWD